MVGNRIKLIRQANALSLQELSDLLADSELPIKRAALSHYELGVNTPSELALSVLARKLGTTIGFFERPDWSDIRFSLFGPVNISGKLETALVSYLQIELEEQLYIDTLLQANHPFVLPTQQIVHRGQEDRIEELADSVRKTYGLGTAPISSVCAALESVGWRIIELPEDFGPIYVSGYEHSKQTGFVLHQSLYVIDDFRTALLKSIGYAYVCGDDSAHTELLVERFARAVLFPRKTTIMEFGTEREEVSISELTFMKQKYGISKRSIMARLKELGIITNDYYNSFEDLMRLHGFPKRKKITSEHLLFYENATRYTMRILEAASRKLISQEELDQLLLLKHML